MYLRKLQIDGVRCLKHVETPLSPHLNVFVGHNGAGKTSVLEAVYLLSRGRSFRSGGADAMTQRGADAFTVHAEVQHGQGSVLRMGVGRRQQRWQVRLNGEAHSGLSAILGQCAVVCFEPGTHELIAGASEHRRRFLDWGVFHVEHGFLEPWRRYQRALRQRNALLRGGGSLAQAQAFEVELSESGTQVDRHRAAYMTRLALVLTEELARLVPELGPVQVHYRRGWAQDRELRVELQAQRVRDQQRGHTTLGAHRADWELSFLEAPSREYLSRGQEKLVALACVLAQAEMYARDHNEWPIVCLDDLASELDGQHQRDVVSRLLTSGAQVLVTGTHLAAGIDTTSARMFHVEHGRVTQSAA